MRQVTRSMAGIVKNLEAASKTMNLEKVAVNFNPKNLCTCSSYRTDYTSYGSV